LADVAEQVIAFTGKSLRPGAVATITGCGRCAPERARPLVTNPNTPDRHGRRVSDEPKTQPRRHRPTLLGRHRTHRFPGRPCRLELRFTPDELTRINEAAQTVGLTPTGFCAEAAVAATKGEQQQGSSRQDRQGLAELQRQLFDAVTAVNRVGTNLNQAAAQLNTTGEAPPWLDRAVQLCQRTIAHIDDVCANVDRALR
jgi:hypothetical protein